MKAKKGCLSVLVACFLAAVALTILISWFQETHPTRFEYVDSKGEKHLAKYCNDNEGWVKPPRPSCILEDGTEVFDVVSFKFLGRE